MNDWQIVGILMTDGRGNFKVLEVVGAGEINIPAVAPGSIVNTPTPMEVKVTGEKSVDYSLEGRLEKLK